MRRTVLPAQAALLRRGYAWSLRDSTLPDPHTRRGLEVQALPRAHVERVVPGIEIAHRVGPVVLRRVVAGGRLRSHGALADLPPLGLRVGDEELPVLLPHRVRIRHPATQRLAVGV